VYRPASARDEHSPVAVRIALEMNEGRLALELCSCCELVPLLVH